jgi:RNase P subunit RPR2
MAKYNCPDCEKADQTGHNYCPSCGDHLTEGYTQNTKVSEARYADQAFCGHCGKKHRGQC